MAGRGAYQKKAQNIVNVRSRHECLISGIKTPASVDMVMRASLVSQRAFAALNLPKRKITPIALNTLKSLADELFLVPDESGRTGFAYLDALRARLAKSITEVAATRTLEAKAKRSDDKIGNLMARLAATEAQSIKRQKAYLSLYQMVSGLIKNGNLQPDAQERLYRVLENHHVTFADLFDPGNGSAIGVEANVSVLRERNKSK